MISPATRAATDTARARHAFCIAGMFLVDGANHAVALWQINAALWATQITAHVGAVSATIASMAVNV